jgi:choline dehydrogenase-like flavoprotein
MQAIQESVAALGYHPYPVPLALKLDEADALHSACIRCDTCDGFPCLVHAKADAEIECIRPVMDLANVTLRTPSKVTTILLNATGTAVTGVGVELEDEHTGAPTTATFNADIVVLSCGAINTAVLLLKCTSHRFPGGLANSSDLVGRNFMFHNSDAMVALSTQENHDRYMKTFGINDFYFGEPDFPYPMGSIQPVGSFKQEMLKSDAPPLTPGFALKMVKDHTVPWWLMTEDLPDANNRVRVVDGRIRLEYTPNNQVRSNDSRHAGSMSSSGAATRTRCSTGTRTSRRTSTSRGWAIRTARAALDRTPLSPCSVSTAARTTWTTCTWSTARSSRRAAP